MPSIEKHLLMLHRSHTYTFANPTPLEILMDLYALNPAADAADEARQLRSSGCPLTRVNLPGGVPVWATTDQITAEEVMSHPGLTKDPQAWTAYRTGQIPPNWPLAALVDGGGFLHKGGEEHARQRRLVAGAFKRTAVGALVPRIKEIANDLLDAFDGSDGTPVDIKEQYAYPFAIRVICELLGLPESATTTLRTHFDHLVRPQEGTDVLAAQAAIAVAFRDIIAAKRDSPGSDLTSELIRAREEDDHLTEEELQQILFLLVIAGHETTVNLVTNAVHALLSHPSALAAVRTGKSTWDDVVDETLRYASPVRYALMWYALHNLEINGVTVEEGDPIIAALFAIGRDPRHHNDPDRFDPTRSTRRDHLAFGHGAHFCLGSILARTEASLSLAALFDRFPEVSLASDERQAFPSISLNGLDTLPVNLNIPEGEPAEVSESRA